ncbi:hypothetical protein [Siccirubricoccus deserti]|uniref:Uncharacterized protein n=1 Tax=Siccirubricoccus deserti TaxID=2013562 RepID=A0A9X0QYV4_9PROT|nr:hypothetical protein [Siccirubricoccus deserti]MBC4016155.1 hypothetical protein [Siccirubricoccus deserti]
MTRNRRLARPDDSIQHAARCVPDSAAGVLRAAQDDRLASVLSLDGIAIGEAAQPADGTLAGVSRPEGCIPGSAGRAAARMPAVDGVHG